MNAACSANINDTPLEKQIIEYNNSSNIELLSTNINTNSSTNSNKLEATEKVKSENSIKTNKTTTNITKTTNNSDNVKSSEIIKQSTTFKTYVEKNGELPKSVKITNKTYKNPQYLYLVCKVLTNTSSNSVIAKNVSQPTNLKYNPKSGNLNKTEYIKLATNIIKFIDANNRAPNVIFSSKGQIPYTQMSYTLVKGLEYYNKNKKLPSSISLEDISYYDKKAIKISKILTQTTTVKNYIQKNGELPKYVKINNKNYTCPEFLYLVSKSINCIENNKNISNKGIKAVSIKNPTNLKFKAINGSLSKKQYLNVVNNTIKFMEENKRPANWVSISKMRIPYTELVFTLTKCLNSYKTSGKLPNKISLEDINKYKATNKTSKKTTNTTKVNTSTVKNSSTQTISNTVKNTTTVINLDTLKNSVLSSVKNQTDKINSNIDSIISNINDKLKNLLNTDTANVENSTKVNSSKVNTTTNTSKVNKTTTKVNTTTNTSKVNKTTTNSLKSKIYNSTIIKQIPKCILNSKYLGDSLKKYLSANSKCQVKNLLIKALARKLTSSSKNNLQKMKKIFNWVRDNVAYEKYKNTKKGAVKVLVTKKGNCVDQTHLTIALSRAAGIPARYVHGRNCKFTSGYTSGHVWGEFLIEDTWVVGDTTSSKNSLGVIKNWNIKNFKLMGKYTSLSF